MPTGPCLHQLTLTRHSRRLARAEAREQALEAAAAHILAELAAGRRLTVAGNGPRGRAVELLPADLDGLDDDEKQAYGAWWAPRLLARRDALSPPRPDRRPGEPA